MKVIAVFDIGRTNKKLVLFDEKFNIVEEASEVLPETQDEDGFVSEDLALLTSWVKTRWEKLLSTKKYEVRAVNVTAYGASLVHLNANDEPITPLYSYLKPLPRSISEKFYSEYGSPMRLALQTASPPMGMLNSGLQMYWLKQAHPKAFSRIKTSFHLPQYIVYLLTGRKASDFTSIGCHTAMWSFEMMDYHEWMKKEGLNRLLAPMIAASSFIHRVNNVGIQAGFGIHDSSSALIPYRMAFKMPFILISTGTWCVNFNPFAAHPLTSDQLNRDCFHYMTPEGSGVKASRLFLGYEHDLQAKRIATYFQAPDNFYKSLSYDEKFLKADRPPFYPASMTGNGPMPEAPKKEWQVSAFAGPEAAYHALLAGLVELLTMSLDLVSVNDVKDLYIDGGFAHNDIFTQLLASKYPNHRVFSSELPYATALGAAVHMLRPQNFSFPGKINLVSTEEAKSSAKA